MSFNFKKHGELAALDERDQAHVDAAMVKRVTMTAPVEGDWVIFQDGVMRRISHCWSDRVQTSDAGSFHLHDSGTMSFSGGLYGCIPLDTLTDSGAVVMAWAWIFHHGRARAHNGVDFQVPVRVWHASIPANN